MVTGESNGWGHTAESTSSSEKTNLHLAATQSSRRAVGESNDALQVTMHSLYSILTTGVRCHHIMQSADRDIL